MYAYTTMATSDPPPDSRPRASIDSTNEEHGFTQDWVDNHSTRVAQRQLEVHDVPRGPPRTQIHSQEEEERK